MDSKAQLRDHSIEEADGLQSVERGLLEAAELRTISAQVGWQPYYCLDVIRAVVREAWDSEGGAVFRRESERASALLAIEQTLALEMAKAQLPRAYDTLTYPFLIVYVWSVAYSYHHDGEVYVLAADDGHRASGPRGDRHRRLFGASLWRRPDGPPAGKVSS